MARRQSNDQWNGGIAAHLSPAPKNSEYKKIRSKFLASFFGDHDGILLIYYIPRGHNMNTEY
jgi:hypothetical protein